MKKPVGDIAAEIRVRSIFFIEENYSKLRVSFDTMISRYVSDYTSVAVLPRLPDMGSSFERYRSDESFALKGVHAQAMLNVRCALKAISDRLEGLLIRHADPGDVRDISGDPCLFGDEGSAFVSTWSDSFCEQRSKRGVGRELGELGTTAFIIPKEYRDMEALMLGEIKQLHEAASQLMDRLSKVNNKSVIFQDQYARASKRRRLDGGDGCSPRKEDRYLSTRQFR